VFMNQVKTHANCMTMDQKKNDYLKEAYPRDEILVMSEFDFPFLRFDIVPRERTIILCLQGFGLVNIIGLLTHECT
jgi:hypothetical protein